MKGKFNRFVVVTKEEFNEIKENKEIKNRLIGYIEHIESFPNQKVDALYVLKHILTPNPTK